MGINMAGFDLKSLKFVNIFSPRGSAPHAHPNPSWGVAPWGLFLQTPELANPTH